MKKDKTLMAIAALVVILLLISFFISGDDKKTKVKDENHSEKHEDGKHEDSDHSGVELENSTSTEGVTGSTTPVGPLSLENIFSENSKGSVNSNPVSNRPTKPTIKYNWNPNQSVVGNESINTETKEEVENSFESARIQYTHDSKILIDVRDTADTPRIRYSNINADPIAILSEKYNISRKEILERTSISYKELNRLDANTIGEVKEADTIVVNGNTLVTVQGQAARYYFWTNESNVYEAARSVSKHIGSNIVTLWDKFFVK